MNILLFHKLARLVTKILATVKPIQNHEELSRAYIPVEKEHNVRNRSNRH
ncbi:hypothetical protein [Endozoicomonas arenosclerae]|nr:hypothetical protein [Endozoicomonas arenosclerae]